MAEISLIRGWRPRNWRCCTDSFSKLRSSPYLWTQTFRHAIHLEKGGNRDTQTLGCKLQVLTASSEQDVDKAFTILALQHMRALFVAPAPFFYKRCDRIIELAARHGILRCTFGASLWQGAGVKAAVSLIRIDGWSPGLLARADEVIE